MKKAKETKLILGVTGSMGSGKSTVATFLAKECRGELIDADRLARECLEPGSSTYVKILKTFMTGILKPQGTIDRQRLANFAFADSALLKKLNKIIHPAVIKKIKDLISRSQNQIIIVDAALLIESALYRSMDKVILVRADLKQQIERVVRAKSFKPEEVKRRLQSQMPFEKKERFADFIIDNRSSISETKKQIRQLIKALFSKGGFSGKA